MLGNHHQLPLTRGNTPRPVKLMTHPRANCLHQKPHRLAGDRNIALHPQNVLFVRQALNGDNQSINIADFGKVDHHGVEVVMFMIVVAVMMRRARGQIVFGLGIQTKDQRRVDDAFAHRQNRDRARRFRLNDGFGSGKTSLARQISLGHQHNIGTGELIFKDFRQRGFMVKAGVSHALRIDSFDIRCKAASGNGFSGAVAVSFGENKTNVADATNHSSLKLQYANGPLLVGYGFQKEETQLTAGSPAVATGQIEDKTFNLLAASYDFGVAKVFFNKFSRKTDITAESAFSGLVTTNSWGLFENGGSLKRTGQDLGVSVPMGKTTLFAAVGSGKYKAEYDATNTLDAKAKARLLGVSYDLSKRTSLNAYYALNKATVDNQVNEISKKNIGFGLRHQF